MTRSWLDQLAIPQPPYRRFIAARATMARVQEPSQEQPLPTAIEAKEVPWAESKDDRSLEPTPEQAIEEISLGLAGMIDAMEKAEREKPLAPEALADAKSAMEARAEEGRVEIQGPPTKLEADLKARGIGDETLAQKKEQAGAGPQEAEAAAQAVPQKEFQEEFPQPQEQEKAPETPAEKVRRLSREALDAKNRWQDAEETPAKPGEEAGKTALVARLKQEYTDKTAELEAARPRPPAPPVAAEQPVRIMPKVEAPPVPEVAVSVEESPEKPIEKPAERPTVAPEKERQEEEPVPGPREAEMRKAMEAVRKAAGPSWFETMGAKWYGAWRDTNRWWWSVLAKEAKDRLAEEDGRVEALEKYEQAFVEKSYLHTAAAPFWVGIMKGKWSAQRRRETFASRLERYNRNMERSEEDRADVWNIAAARIEDEIKYLTVQAESHAAAAVAADETLARLFADQQEQSLRVAQERTPNERTDAQIVNEDFFRRIREIRETKSRELKKRNELKAVISERQSEKNEILMGIDDISPDTAPPKPRRLEMVRKKSRRKQTEAA